MKRDATNLLLTVVLVFLGGCSMTKPERPDFFAGVQQITVGTTTRPEAEQWLGKPDEIKHFQFLEQRMMDYYYEAGARQPHQVTIAIQCDCVVLIQEQVFGSGIDQTLYVTDMLEEFGEPELVLGSLHPSGEGTFLYAQKGVAVTAPISFPPDYAIVFERIYFEPMTVEQFLETWGVSFPLEVLVDPRWEDYVYQLPYPQ